MNKDARIALVKSLRSFEADAISSITNAENVLRYALPFVPFQGKDAVLGWSGLRIVVSRPMDTLPTTIELNAALTSLIDSAVHVAETLP
jgi:hypothetical protein